MSEEKLILENSRLRDQILNISNIFNGLSQSYESLLDLLRKKDEVAIAEILEKDKINKLAAIEEEKKKISEKLEQLKAIEKKLK